MLNRHYRYLIVLLFCLLPSVVCAGYVINSFGTFGGAAPSYDLIDEEFEGAGTPSGWTAGGDFDYATTPAPLTGSESLYLTAGQTTEKTFTTQTHLYGHLQINNSGVANSLMINLKLGGSTAMYLSMVDGTGGNTFVRLSHGTTTVDTGNFVNGTLYIWYEYDNTGLGSVWVSTTTTKPGSPSATTSTGTSTISVTSLKLYIGTNATIFDRAYMSTTSIGSL